MACRKGIGRALLLAMAPTMAGAATAGAAASPRQIEAEVLAALNLARADPANYATTLKTYRGFYHADIVIVPGAIGTFQTEEGVRPVDEAIAFLGDQPTLAGLEPSDLLTQAAADHVADQSISGQIGHYGPDGSTPGQRVARHGGGKGVAEVIAYGATDPVDVIRQLIIDDGVSDRGHRLLLFLGHLRYAGIACGPHPRFRTMCVIDMADTPDGRLGASPELRMARRDIASIR